MSKDSKAKLITLAVIFLGLITYPVLNIFDQERLLAGMPALYIYVFAVWAVVIALTALITSKSKNL